MFKNPYFLNGFFHLEEASWVFFVMFSHIVFSRVPEATWAHLGFSLGQVGASWWDFEVQLGPKLRQVGSRLGPDRPKIRFLKDFVACPTDVQ